MFTTALNFGVTTQKFLPGKPVVSHSPALEFLAIRLRTEMSVLELGVSRRHLRFLRIPLKSLYGAGQGGEQALHKGW